MAETATEQSNQSGNTNQPTTPAAPAAPTSPPPPSSPQQQESSPFMDGTSWDQIVQQKFDAKPEPPKEFVFADGKTLAEADYRTPDKPAEQKPDGQQAEPAKGDTSTQQPSDQAKPAEPATSGTPDEAETSDDEYTGLIKKYGNDPKAWAKAYLGNQRLVSQKDVEIRAYKEALANQFRVGQMPQGVEPTPKADAAQPTKPAETQPAQVTASADLSLDDEAIQNLVAELADDPAMGIKKLLTTAQQTAQAAAAAYRQQEIQREQAAQREAELRGAEEQNMRLLFNRVREMKLDDARHSGDEAAKAKYGNANYQVDQAEYLDVYPRIKAEFDFIMENMAPKDGKLTEAHFKRAKLLLDPPDIDQLIRDAEQKTEQRVRAQVLKEIQDGQKNGQRVVIQPAAPVKSSVELDFSTLQGDKDTLQSDVFSKMSDDQLTKLLEQAQLGHRGALAS